MKVYVLMETLQYECDYVRGVTADHRKALEWEAKPDIVDGETTFFWFEECEME